MADQPKVRVFNFDSSEPGDAAAMRRLVDRDGPPQILIESTKDLVAHRVIFPYLGGGMILTPQGLDNFIKTLTTPELLEIWVRTLRDTQDVWRRKVAERDGEALDDDG
jgi:hypothetical protein